jgi:hypothetical protein
MPGFPVTAGAVDVAEGAGETVDDPEVELVGEGELDALVELDGLGEEEAPNLVAPTAWP